jgi:hypothetical protein
MLQIAWVSSCLGRNTNLFCFVSRFILLIASIVRERGKLACVICYRNLTAFIDVMMHIEEHQTLKFHNQQDYNIDRHRHHRHHHHFSLSTSMFFFVPFLRRVRKIAKRDYYYLRHVCPSACNNSAPTGQIFMKCDICVFFENFLRKSKFH